MNFLNKMTLQACRTHSAKANFTKMMLFNQRQNSMLVPVSQKWIHQRGYTNFDDHYSIYFHETNMALMNAKNTTDIAFVYEKYGDYMTDKQIVQGFWYIAMNKLEKTPDFWNRIVPLVKQQLQGLDRETVPSLFKASEGAAGMYLQDNEFWEIVEQKLVDEGLHRYFTLEQSAQLLCQLARVGRGSDDMVELIEKTFIKHRKGLTPEVIEIAQQGFRKINKGSEILHRVLDDPTVELPALE